MWIGRDKNKVSKGFIGHISDKDFMRAVNILIRTSKYFPAPMDFIKASIPENAITAEDDAVNVRGRG